MGSELKAQIEKHIMLLVPPFCKQCAFDYSFTCVGDIVHNYGSLSAAVVHRSKGVIPEKGIDKRF